MLCEEINAKEWNIGISQIDRILEEHRKRILEEIGTLETWYEKAKETLEHEQELRKSYNIEAPDPTETTTKSKEVMEGFVLVDQIVEKITKGYSKFKKWLRKRLEEILSWIKWPLDWAREAIIDLIMAQICAPAEIFIKILNTNVAKMILSGIYQLIRAGASIIEIIAGE